MLNATRENLRVAMKLLSGLGTPERRRRKMSIERDNKISMEGGFVTAALRAAFEQDGIDAAMALVEDGLTREQVLAVCEHKARIGGSTRTELTFVEEVEPGY
jgi:coenzyme F420-reducing hydrogenase beta subunit